MKLLFETVIHRDLKTVKAGFNKDLFMALKPPGVNLDVARFDGCEAGHEVHLNIKSFGVAQKWVSHITEDKETPEEWYFVDEGHQIPWPLSSWKHIHRVIFLGENSSKIVDDISFECVYSWMNPLFYPILWSSFSVRPSRYKKFFEGP